MIRYSHIKRTTQNKTTSRKEQTTMKNSTPRIDRDKKTIYATKSFLINA